MILPEHESSSCTPRELELKSDSLLAPPTTSPPSTSEADGSVWSAFRMESFLGNYCHTSASRSLTPSLSFHNPSEEASESDFDHLPTSVTPRPTPPALSPAHWSRLKDSSANETNSSLNTTPIPALHSPSLPSSSLVSPTPRYLPVPHINPLMAQRQRQQAFMSRWNCVRQRNRHTPAMPSFFNPIRQEAPGCSWNFLRDPACGGDVNERLSARRGRDSVYEKPLVKLPLTRCRSSCDRIRRDQQNLLGWGIHAWIAPSKHCRYCITDELLKGFLMFRSYEAERIEQEMRRREEQQEQSILFMNADEALEDDCIDSDAVLLSFPYRTPSVPHDQQDQIQSIPTEPWINYQDLDSSSHAHLHTHTSCVSQSPAPGKSNRRNPDPKDISTWSAELEKRLLASPIIRDIDDFDLEDDDLEGFDDEDLEYYDSDEEEEEEEEYSSSGSSSPTSDSCECGVESGCRCPTIVIGGEAEGDNNDSKPAPVDVINEVAKEDSKKTMSNSDKKTATAICGKVLMSFWEEEDDLDGVDCVRVDVEQVDGCVEVDELGMSMSVVDADKWVMNDMRVVEVQCQA
ncbi:hypothetical protein NP233_g8403 [Leucocoprinus birnbaumii]|uniref:Uncharacterized protein n=1 Tax=Leucocoprinus birnbaumii TaxID=56174 RepID=A0AAD5YTT2_9AGAR|nr:hypothetical protein NP233_g8403 [Leucocoprinus birnbaumii]